MADIRAPCQSISDSTTGPTNKHSSSSYSSSYSSKSTSLATRVAAIYTCKSISLSTSCCLDPYCNAASLKHRPSQTHKSISEPKTAANKLTIRDPQVIWAALNLSNYIVMCCHMTAQKDTRWPMRMTKARNLSYKIDFVSDCANSNNQLEPQLRLQLVHLLCVNWRRRWSIWLVCCFPWWLWLLLELLLLLLLLLQRDYRTSSPTSLISRKEMQFNAI